MSRWQEITLAVRLLARDHRAGELFLIGVALAVAVASVTTVGFFADRVHRALNRQANQLLGADLVVVADRPLTSAFESEARRRGLAVTRMLRFPSMVLSGEKNVLASVKAVAEGYPLRGEVRIAERPYGADRKATAIPPRGSAWVDERLLAQLELSVGATVALGAGEFRVAAVLTHEPDTSIGFINSGPRIYVNEADLAQTGLVQTGSRIRYRLQMAGADAAVDAYRAWALPRLDPGQRIEGIRDARPEIRSALDRAEKFLSLAALVSVVLAAVAIALSARRFLQRHLDGCAMMRCMGASQGLLVRLYLAHFALMGAVASLAGCAVGVVAQFALAHWLTSLVAVQLPAPGWLPAIQGVATGLLLLLGFALPPLVALGRVPTLRVLRRELGAPRATGMAGYAAAFAVIAGLILWKAHDLRLGSLVLGGFVGTLVAAGAVTWLMIALLARVRYAGGIAWRFGIGNLRRHVLGSVIQVVALGLGIMALLTLTVIRGDLLKAWQTSLPPDAPNRFIVNIQPDQLQPLAEFFTAREVTRPPVYPMVRGRLVRINERGVSSADYVDDRARRLVDREFNLSWATTMQPDNELVAGRWWSASARPDQFSMESGIAEALGVRVGDVLTFDVAGRPVTGTVTSLRKVDWDSFNVNFFVVAPPALLADQPVSYITSFYLPPGRAGLVSELAQAFPNFLLIDVAQIMAQVQKMMAQVARAMQFVFLFTLAAGLVVLYAAIASTQDERLYQATIMRTLGASRVQIALANLAEFAALGVLAGVLAAAGATALGYLLALKVLNLSYGVSGTVWLAGVLCGAAGIAAAGYLGTRRVLAVAPLRVLQRLT